MRGTRRPAWAAAAVCAFMADGTFTALLVFVVGFAAMTVCSAVVWSWGFANFGVYVAEHQRAAAREGLTPLRIDWKQTIHDCRILDARRPDINHRGAWLDEISSDEPRPPDRGDKNVALASDPRQVDGSRVADRDRRMPLQQQQRHRFAHDVAAADDDRAGPGNGNPRSIQQRSRISMTPDGVHATRSARPCTRRPTLAG